MESQQAMRPDSTSTGVKSGNRGHELRALSVKFLSDGFLSDLNISDKDNVYDIEPRLRDASKGKCPRDKRPGSAYVDAADDPNAGVANYMLSYTWGDKVYDIIDALKSFCMRENKQLEDVRVWLCCICVNQHRVKERQEKGEKVEFNTFSQTFGGKVNSIGNVLAMLSPWDDPLYIQRLWCIYEFTMAMNADDVNLVIILPTRQKALFKESLYQAQGISSVSKIFHALGNIEIQSAKASYDEDRRNILENVAPGISIDNSIEMNKACAKYNEDVVRKLQSWFVDTIHEDLKLQLLPAKMTTNSMQVLASFVSLCNIMGGDKRNLGLKLINRAIRISSESDLTNSIDYCNLIRQKGTIHRYENDFAQAMELYEEAKEKLEALGETEVKIYLLHDISICLALMGKLAESLKMAELSRLAYIRGGKDNTADYANLLKSIGMTQVKQGEIESGLESYNASIQLFEDLKISPPWYFDALVQLGKVYMLENEYRDIAKAEQLLGRAVVGLKSAGVVDGKHFKTATEELARLRSFSHSSFE